MFRLALAILALCFISGPVVAEIPSTLSYQGLLKDAEGVVVTDGDYQLTFRIYNVPTGGSALWTETQTLPVAGGVFDAILGSVTALNLPFDTAYWLGVQVASDPELSPRVTMTAAAYALGAAPDGDWIITGDDIYRLAGRIGIGTMPDRALPRRGDEKTRGERDPQSAKVRIDAENEGLFVRMVDSDEVSDERAAIYGLRSSGLDNAGSGFAVDETNSAVTGYNEWGDSYTYGVAGYTYHDYPHTAGVLGSDPNGNTWAALSYVDPDYNFWGLYTESDAYVGGELVVEDFTMPYGAASGHVLTSNADGEASWEPPEVMSDGDWSINGNNIYHIDGLVTVGSYSNAAGKLYVEAETQNPFLARNTYTGTGANYSGMIGECNLLDGRGTGGTFRGGKTGVYAEISPTGSDYYRGLHSYVVGGSGTNYGLLAYVESEGATNYAVYATRADGGNYAGRFHGNVWVDGTLTKNAGAFKIDHPLDPTNKYLSHSFVESPDMKNIYDGLVELNTIGEAWVILPEWFEALNMEFRYQLTPIGAPGPNLYIADEIRDNRFRIAGGVPGTKVSWMVTGIRHDPYAEKHRIPVEELKPSDTRGYYLSAEAYGQPREMSEDWQLHRKPILEQEARLRAMD